jgi:hypothetical protein
MGTGSSVQIGPASYQMVIRLMTFQPARQHDVEQNDVPCLARGSRQRKPTNSLPVWCRAVRNHCSQPDIVLDQRQPQFQVHLTASGGVLPDGTTVTDTINRTRIRIQ